jgi:ankyrin repeat protein
VLSAINTDTSRNAYLELRRQIRGRPPHPEAYSHWTRRRRRFNAGDLKASEIEGLVVSNYDTVHIPYGRGFHAKKIEKLMFQKDLILNAEWNTKNVPPERPYKLHRHPCFFGDMADIFEDCCRYCPEPDCEEAIAVQKEEDANFIRGNIAFLVDDPGRQSVGSFNPITEGDWSEMAYLSQEAQFALAVAQNDVKKVSEMIGKCNPNKRDHTGRAMLFLAGQCGNNDVARVLVENGARLTARNFDGRTILHLACQMGNLDLLEIILAQSKINALNKETKEKLKIESEAEAEGSDDGFEKIQHSDAKEDVDEYTEDEEDDILDLDLPDWDYFFTPLHHALFFGHISVAKHLIEEGADATIPAKITRPPEFSRSTNITVFPIVLCGNAENCVELARLLRRPGVGSQSDAYSSTALHAAVATKHLDLVDEILAGDLQSSAALSHLTSSDPPVLPIHVAIMNKDLAMVKMLIKYGSPVHISEEMYKKYVERKNPYWRRYGQDDPKEVTARYKQEIFQPLEVAVMDQSVELVHLLMDSGANVNAAPRAFYKSWIRRE